MDFPDANPVHSISPVSFTEAVSAWESVPCALCGTTAAAEVLMIPHAPAPAGHSAVVACRHCGLRRLEPRPGPELIGSYYAAAGGDSYNAYVGRKRSARTQAVWNLLRDGYARPAGQGWVSRFLGPLTGALANWAFDINVRLQRRRGLRVLEVGAGYGDILIYLRERGCEVLGTDLSAAAAAKAQEYGVEVRLGNLKELALPAASFDAAIMCHSLEHVPDPNVELAELRRLLKPGGELHIAVPNGHAVRLAQDGLAFAHLSFPLHFWFFDPESLACLLARHGFVPLKGPWTTTRHHALNAWLSGCRREGVLAATRRFWRFFAASLGRSDGGDVLRVVAQRSVDS